MRGLRGQQPSFSSQGLNPKAIITSIGADAPHKNGDRGEVPSVGRGHQRNPARVLKHPFSPSAVSWASLSLPSPPGRALHSPSLSRHFMLKTLFRLFSLPHIPIPQLGTSGPLPNTSAPVPLVESDHHDCWAGLKRGTPRVLPPPAVTAAAAASALLRAPCRPLTSSSSSFSPSSSLGCVQT